MPSSVGVRIAAVSCSVPVLLVKPPAAPASSGARTRAADVTCDDLWLRDPFEWRRSLGSVDVTCVPYELSGALFCEIFG